jgi:hypothetical protein
MLSTCGDGDEPDNRQQACRLCEVSGLMRRIRAGRHAERVRLTFQRQPHPFGMMDC